MDWYTTLVKQGTQFGNCAALFRGPFPFGQIYRSTNSLLDMRYHLENTDISDVRLRHHTIVLPHGEQRDAVSRWVIVDVNGLLIHTCILNVSRT